MIVTFFGHAQILQREEIEKWLYVVTENLIEQGAITFYLGGYGAFDSLAASVLRVQKKGTILNNVQKPLPACTLPQSGHMPYRGR